MNRRNFLRGLLASAAVTTVRADRVVTLLAPTENRFEAYTSHFKWNVGHLDDWRYCVRAANIDISMLSTSSAPPDIFATLKQQPATILPGARTWLWPEGDRLRKAIRDSIDRQTVAAA